MLSSDGSHLAVYWAHRGHYQDVCLRVKYSKSFFAAKFIFIQVFFLNRFFCVYFLYSMYHTSGQNIQILGYLGFTKFFRIVL